MELHLSSVSIFIIWFFSGFIVAGFLSYAINYFNDRMNPDDPYDFLKKYVGKKVEYKHPKYKIVADGNIVAIEQAGKGGTKGKPNYNIVILDGNSKHRESIYTEGKAWRIVK